MRFLSFGRGHRVYSDYSAAQTRNSSVERRSSLSFSLIFVTVSHAFAFTHSHTERLRAYTPFGDTWCHVQLLIFITRNSRKLEQLQKWKGPYAKLPCNRLFGLCAIQSLWMPSATNNCTHTDVQTNNFMSIWSAAHTRNILRVFIFFLLLRLFKRRRRRRSFAFCYFLLPLSFAHSLVWVFLFFVSILSCALYFCGSTIRSYLAHIEKWQ